MQGHVLKKLIHALEKLHEASFSSTSLDPSHIQGLVSRETSRHSDEMCYSMTTDHETAFFYDT